MIQVDEYHYSRRKTLAVCIDTLGRVIVRAPKGYPQKKINDFLSAKQDWILRRQQAKKACAVPLPTSIDGYRLPYLGDTLLLRVYEGQRVREGDGVLYLPQKDTEKRLISWLKKRALAVCRARTDFWQGIMGVTCKDVKVSVAKRKWGSCSSKDEIRYTYRLLYAPVPLIDYVVVHELAHIRHKNHSASFWREVGKYMPDYASRRVQLHRLSSLLEIF